MKKAILLSLFLALIFVLSPSAAHADGCVTIYGGGLTCGNTNLSITKSVLNPRTNTMVHSLGKNDPAYFPRDIITFQIKVTNKSTAPISSLTIKDNFPQYVTFSSGPGTFDTATKTFTATVVNLPATSTATITILGRIVPNDQIPQSNISTCISNFASVITTDNQTIQDSSQFCIQNRPLTFSSLPNNTKHTPATGPEMLPLLGLIPLFASGIYLRKKTSLR